MATTYLKGYIVVPYFFNDLSNKALDEGKRLAQVFKSHLVLFACGSDEKERHLLGNISGKLMQEGFSASSYMVEKSLWKKMLLHFSTKNDVVTLVYAHDSCITQRGISLRREISFLRKQRSPFLMINEQVSKNDYSKVVLLVDYPPIEKEKILWATYFARRYRSYIYVLVPEARDMFLRVKIRSNLQSLEKLYNNLSIPYEVVNLRASNDNLMNESIRFATSIEAGCFLHLTSNNLDIFRIFEGDPDVKIIRKATEIPILCINPRDDLYVLCQ